MKSPAKSVRLKRDIDQRIQALKPHLNFSAVVRRSVLAELPKIEAEVQKLTERGKAMQSGQL